MSDSLEIYEKWMRYALIEGIKAFDSGEVPIGAIIVKDGEDLLPVLGLED